MASSQLPKIPYPNGAKAERSGLGAGPMYDLIAHNDFGMFTKDYVFVGDALPAEIDTATNGTAAAVAAAANGLGITLTTGTDDNGYAGIALSLGPWNGDKGLLFESWVEMPATATTMKIEAGVTDALADAGAVLDKAAATATATDYAVFAYDTDDDTTLAFHSAKAGTVVASEGLIATAASKKLYLAIRVVGDNVDAWYGDSSLSKLTKVTGHGGGAGIEGATALTPWIFAQARVGAASRALTVKRMRITGPII